MKYLYNFCLNSVGSLIFLCPKVTFFGNSLGNYGDSPLQNFRCICFSTCYCFGPLNCLLLCLYNKPRTRPTLFFTFKCYDLYLWQTHTLEEEAYPALDELTSQISTLNLERVRQIKSRLVALSGRVQKVNNHALSDNCYKLWILTWQARNVSIVKL